MIRLQNLSVTYPTTSGPHPVLKGIDLHLRTGEFAALLGANGSGKTTLLRSLNGLVAPTDGDVYIDDLSVRNPHDLARIRERVGMVFQNPDDQIVSVQVEREVAFGLENLRVPSAEMQRRVADILDRFHLSHYRRHDPSRLSGGERQRLALASVIAMRPRYLLLDEPTALLDPDSRRDFLTLLRDLHLSGDITPILVTQIPAEAVDAGRVVVLSDGRIALDGPPSEVFSQVAQLESLGLSAPLPARVAVAIGLLPPLPLNADDLINRLPNTPGRRPSRPAHSPRVDALERQPHPISAEADRLTHIYHPGLSTEVRALDAMDLSLPKGAITALIGPGGSGKSTFAQHLNGLLAPTGGALTVCGLNPADPASHRALRRRVGLVFQFPEAQLFADSVFDDVAFGPRNLGLSDLETRVDQSLQDVGMDPRAFLDRSPLTLSGGEKRRVAIAGVLAMHPELLVMDEPTAGLDPGGIAHAERWMRQLRDDGCTLLIITHDLDLALRVADRIVALKDGRVVLDEIPERAFSGREHATDFGLGRPSIVRMADRLRKAGWPIPWDAITTEAIGRCLLDLCS